MKIRIIAVILAVVLMGCSSEREKEKEKKPDLYAAFKADAAERFEGAGNSNLKNTDATHLFYADRGVLFSSPKSKLGYVPRNSQSFYFIEWDGDFSPGTKSNPSLRTPSGVVSMHSLEIIKAENTKVWIVYKQTATSPEGRIVQNRTN